MPNLATEGNPGRACDLKDPELPPAFAALPGGRLKAVERRLIQDTLDSLGRNARVPERTVFVASRLTSEMADDIYAALAAKALACALPEEGRAFLAGCGGGDDSGFHLTGI